MKRYQLIDGLRGFTVINMVIYHLIYNLKTFYGFHFPDQIYYYQQSICWSFILLSGFSMSFSKHLPRKIIILSMVSIVITGASYLLFPEETIYFGVIHFFAAATLLFYLFRKVFYRFPKKVGILLNVFLFAVTKSLPEGTLFFSKLSLPSVFYQKNLFYLGLPSDSFSSGDYFPIIPWIFLFLTGFYAHFFISLSKKEKSQNILHILGRHSLIIYLLHQPLLLGVLYCIFH